MPGQAGAGRSGGCPARRMPGQADAGPGGCPGQAGAGRSGRYRTTWPVPDEAGAAAQTTPEYCSLDTISTPSGISEIGMILKLAMPSGMPMIVTHSSAPVTR